VRLTLSMHAFYYDSSRQLPLDYIPKFSHRINIFLYFFTFSVNKIKQIISNYCSYFGYRIVAGDPPTVSSNSNVLEIFVKLIINKLIINKQDKECHLQVASKRHQHELLNWTKNTRLLTNHIIPTNHEMTNCLVLPSKLTS
jgi:hypothetical protein